MRGIALRAAVIAASVVTGGCGLSGPPQVLVPSQFVRSRNAVGPNPIGQPVGHGGALDYGELHSPLVPDEYTNNNPKPSPGVSPLVQHDVPAPGERSGNQPVTQTPAPPMPASQPNPGIATGYQVVGTVLATVNSKAIFADQVLATLEHELAAEAHKYGAQEFRTAARYDIEAEREKQIQGQLEIEQANANLSADAKKQAELIAQLWRRQQVTAAGGSEAIARERALESGKSLDDQTKEQYNIALVRLYYQQHILPRILVTPAAMRRYYQEHLQSEFSKPDEARYRLIRIDFDRSGGPEKAAEKATRIIADLKAGASFSEEAKKFNDDSSLMHSGGDMGWMQRGSFKFDKVEDAVWALQPHQFTDHPIEVTDPNSGGGAYFIAYLEDKRGGTVQPFESEAVQNAINAKLSSQQFNEYRIRDLQHLTDQAVVIREPSGLDAAVEMAMQRYAVWVTAR